jgi:hypothetical protein
LAEDRVSHRHKAQREDGEAAGPAAVTAGKRSLIASRYPALAQVLGDRNSGAGEPTIHDAATAAVEHKGGGAAVDPAVAARVGAHLGADLSSVRVHSDPLIQQATAAMGARAFAYGSDVFLGPGESGSDLGLMAHELTHVVQQGAAGQCAPQRAVTVGEANSPAEHQADKVAAEVTGGTGHPAALLVDDAPVGPGQMLKSQFLDQLRAQITDAANQELGPVYSAIGCPYIDQYFGRYAGQSASAGEALLRRYAPGTADCKTAAAMIPIVVARVREGVRQWKETGQPPSGLPGDAAATAPMAAMAMGPGKPLDGVAAARIGDAMGESLADVQVHIGPDAQRFAASQGAVAVTAGKDIAFASGAYQPGTPAGDALLAHELAHVVQQRGAAPTAARAIADSGGAAHETDADQAAVGVMARLWGGVRSAARSVAPVLRADYGLQRCSTTEGRKVPVVATDADEAKRKAAVDALVKANKYDDALDYICNAYGFNASNVRVEVVDNIEGAWAQTSGDIGEGEIETIKVRKNLFEQDWAFIVRTIGHEYQHVLQRTQKDPIKDSNEREFLAWSWEAIDPTGPQYDGPTAAKHAKKALTFYDKLSDEQKKKYADRKKKLDELIAKNP